MRNGGERCPICGWAAGNGFWRIAPGGGSVKDGLHKIHIIKIAQAFQPKTSPSRKMFRQQFTGFADAVSDAFRELGFTKMTGHGLRQFLPKSIAAFCVNASVPDHRKFAAAWGHKNQHAISFRRLGHA
jgi:hypothetical protein